MSAVPEDFQERGVEPGDPAGARPPSTTPPPQLRAALRTARVEEAERSRAIADLRGIAVARLELLREGCEPVLAQVPADVDLFDLALAAGQHPRLFIDMIAFVEMAEDRRRYRFLQDTREGRVTLAESERVDTVVAAVTAYVARRLVERDRALATTPRALSPTPPPPHPRPKGWLRRAWRIGLEYLGLASLVVLLWVAGHALYQWLVPGGG